MISLPGFPLVLKCLEKCLNFTHLNLRPLKVCIKVLETCLYFVTGFFHFWEVQAGFYSPDASLITITKRKQMDEKRRTNSGFGLILSV